MRNKRSMKSNTVDLGSDSDDGGDSRRGGAVFGEFKVALVNVIGGMIFGFAIGMTAIVVFAHGKFERCGAQSEKDVCLGSAACVWNTEDGEFPQCEATSSKMCHAISSAAECSASHLRCHFNDGASVCEALEGWDSFQTGVFVAAMTVGGLFGSLIAGMSRRTTRRRDLVLCAMLFAASTLASHIFYFSNDFWPLCGTRVGVGIAVGALCVLCPLYVGENTLPSRASLFGALFQIFITLGIFFAAFVGWMLQNDERVAHAMLLVSNLIALQMVPVGWMLESSCIPSSPQLPSDDLPHEKRPSVGISALFADNSVRLAFLAAMVLSCAQQLTGINAVMNYAPSMAKSAGFEPLTGNLIIMFWNFVTTLVSIPLSARYQPKVLFLRGLLGASISCLVTFVGMTQHIATGGAFWTFVSCMGMACFILAFECGMGPMFFILATEVFPKHLRDNGCSVVNVSQFIFNLVVAFTFPLAVEAWSPSSDQSIVGTSRTFAVFGGIGLACFVALQRLL